MPNLAYTGRKQPKPGEKDQRGRPREPYVPEPELVMAVNIAITLGRPLLVLGEPGSGKTKLAAHVAYELDLPLHEWTVKSTSKARDGLYEFDAIRRLADAQLARFAGQAEQTEDRLRPEKYLRWGALGAAIRAASPRAEGAPSRSVVLIDEIDKADIDFPNDLLLELDELRFTVDELDDESEFAAQPELKPIIIITSNNEKSLPDAFLRRCVFHYINFPKLERLRQIVQLHLAADAAGEELIGDMLEQFLRLRDEIVRSDGVIKQPGTSELIDLLRWLLSLPPRQRPKSLREPGPFGLLVKQWDERVKSLQDRA